MSCWATYDFISWVAKKQKQRNLCCGETGLNQRPAPSRVTRTPAGRSQFFTWDQIGTHWFLDPTSS